MFTLAGLDALSGRLLGHCVSLGVRLQPFGHHAVRQHFWLGPRTDVRDHGVRLCLAKRETVVVDDLYTMAANGTYNCDGGWNHKRCLAGASDLMFSVAIPAL